MRSLRWGMLLNLVTSIKHSPYEQLVDGIVSQPQACKYVPIAEFLLSYAQRVSIQLPSGDPGMSPKPTSI